VSKDLIMFAVFIEALCVVIAVIFTYRFEPAPFWKCLVLLQVIPVIILIIFTVAVFLHDWMIRP